ncbi:MAG: intradiol ring-cleavage dioxygenase [Acidobacteriota bacterium]
MPEKRTLTRRETLGLIGAAGAVWSVGCGTQPTTPSGITSGAAPAPPPPGTGAACLVTPTETAGPFPNLGDFARSDIREGRPGLPLTLTITVVNVNRACAALVGAFVEVWQCDAAGQYSQYGTEQSQTYLRGVQITDAAGRVTFTTIYPGWYQGRATHIHAEIKIGGRSIKVTQIAFPEAVSAAVYGTTAYAAKGQNPTSNSGDSVFRDGVASQLATLVGDATRGYTASSEIGVEV